MASTVCPLYSDLYYSYDIDLDSVNYTLTFRFNDRMNGYTLDIQDSEQNSIVSGMRLVPSFPLLREYSLSEPAGYFYLVPYNSNQLFADADKGRELHMTHFLMYESGV